MSDTALIIGIEIIALLSIIGCVSILIYMLKLVSTMNKEMKEIKTKLLEENKNKLSEHRNELLKKRPR